MIPTLQMTFAALVTDIAPTPTPSGHSWLLLRHQELQSWNHAFVAHLQEAFRVRSNSVHLDHDSITSDDLRCSGDGHRGRLVYSLCGQQQLRCDEDRRVLHHLSQLHSTTDRHGLLR